MDTIHKTINDSFKNLETAYDKAVSFCEKNKKDIYISSTEAVRLYILGMDPRFIK